VSYGNKPNEIRHPQAALLAEEYVCQRVQSLGYTGDLNSEEVNQLTDANIVEVVDSDPSVSITIDLNEFGSINILNQLSGYHSYPSHADTALYADGVLNADNTNSNDGTISHTTFGDVATDFLVSIKESESATASSRALWFNNCFIDSISGTYQVDGFATESVSISGASQRWFLNVWAGARIGIPDLVSGPAGHLDVTHTDGSVAYLTEDGVLLSDTYWGQNATGDITGENGYSFGPSGRFRYIWVSNTPVFPTIGQDVASNVGGVKEGELEIIMWDTTQVSTEPIPGVTGSVDYKMLRVQSVDYEISFDREDLKQIYTGTYYKGLNNTSITATITVNDSDLEMWAMVAGKFNEWNTSASDVTTLSLSDFQSMSNIGLRIDVFNTKDYLLHAQSTLLKSIRFLGGKVTSVSDSRDVPGRGAQTFDLQFNSADYIGTGLVGR